MPSPPSADRGRFGGPWQLFTWSLEGTPGVAAAFLATLVGVLACELAVPRLLAEAIDAALIEGSLTRVDVAGLLILAVVALLYLVHVAYIRLETRVLYGAVLRLRGLLTRRILEQPIDFFTRARVGELTHTVLNDTEVLENHGVYVFSDVPFATLTILAILALMMMMDWRMALAVVGFLVAAMLLSFRLGRPLPTLRRTIQHAASQMSAALNEAIGGIRTVKGFGRVGYEQARLDRLAREVAALEVREGTLGAWVEPLLELVELLGVALIVWYGAHRIVDRAMSAGTLVAFIAYMELLSEPVSHTGRYLRHVQACRGVMQRLVHFLDGLALPPPAGRERPQGPREIRFDGVNYHYPGATRAAVQDVTFAAKHGELIVLVGANGAGKSTLMEVLLGFREPQQGSVRVAGVPPSHWDPGLWHRTIALLPQEVFLFHATLADNIAYGRIEATPGEIELAAHAAGLGPLLKRLPEGLATTVGDRGQRLSGGERQRVALARLLLNDPAIVVLDEPTAALDGGASRDVARLMVELSRTRTVFVIAHRHEAASVANRILLMDEGRLVFDGTPAAAGAHLAYQRLFAASHPEAKQVAQLRG